MRISRAGLESGENGGWDASEEDMAVIQVIWTRRRTMAVKVEKLHR